MKIYWSRKWESEIARKWARRWMRGKEKSKKEIKVESRSVLQSSVCCMEYAYFTTDSNLWFDAIRIGEKLSRHWAASMRIKKGPCFLQFFWKLFHSRHRDANKLLQNISLFNIHLLMSHKIKFTRWHLISGC